jgi:hypothetical protein
MVYRLMGREGRRVTAFFCGDNMGLIYKIGGKCEKVWAIFGKS